jgi:hypothetical protein
MIISPLIGLVLGVGVGYVGALIGFVAGCGASGNLGSCVGGLVIGAEIGYVIGAPLGVTWASNWFGGLGNYGWALLGSLVGAVASIPLIYAVDDAGVIAWSAILPAVGAMIFYEIGGGIRESRIRAGTEMAISPTVIPVMNENRIAGAAFGLRVANF